MFPYQTVLRYMDKTVERQVEQLTEWTERTEPSRHGDAAAEPPEMAIETDNELPRSPAVSQAELGNEVPTTPTALVRPHIRSSIDLP